MEEFAPKSIKKNVRLSLDYFTLVAQDVDGDRAIPNFVSMVLEAEVPFIILPKLLPRFEFAGFDFFLPVRATDLRIDDFITI